MIPACLVLAACQSRGSVHAEAAQNDADATRAYVSGGGVVDQRDIQGRTPLHHAAEHHAHEVAEVLLESGADIGAISHDGATPLHLAAKSHCSTLVQRFLSHGAYPDARAEGGLTPLLVACGGTTQAPRPEANCRLQAVVDFLLEAGSDPNATSQEGWTPLFLAAGHGHDDVIAHLLDKGGNINATTRDDVTPLMNAAYYGHRGTVSLLLDQGGSSEEVEGLPEHMAKTLMLTAETLAPVDAGEAHDRYARAASYFVEAAEAYDSQAVLAGTRSSDIFEENLLRTATAGFFAGLTGGPVSYELQDRNSIKARKKMLEQRAADCRQLAETCRARANAPLQDSPARITAPIAQ